MKKVILNFEGVVNDEDNLVKLDEFVMKELHPYLIG